MSKIIFIFILIFTTQSFSKAEDIRDFEIEGISIGDSALKHFNKKEIYKNKKNWFTNKDYSHVEFRNLSKFKQYEDIHLNYLSNDKKFTIVAIEGISFFRNKVGKCLKKMNEIDTKFKNLFKNADRSSLEKNKHNDSRIPGKNYVTDILYTLTSGDRVILACYDWSKESGYGDHLRISLRTKRFDNWLYDKAYE